MDRDENDQHNNDMTILPSIQERRMQLEAYQAERALNKSLRASIRPVDHSPRPSQSFTHSVFDSRSRKSLSVRDVQQSKEAIQDSGAKQKEQKQHQPSSTRSIIQHYNALSKTSKPTSNTLFGVRRHGAVAHRVEKKPLLTRPGTTSYHSSIWRDNGTSDTVVPPGGAPTALIDAEHTKGHQSTQEDTSGSSWSSGTSAPKASDTFGVKSIRQDRATTVSSAKRQEEIYLSQARLLQWYLMNKRAAEQFSAQEKSAEAQFELVGRLLLEKQVKLQNLQKRFEVEQDLVELESTLGCQRDQLLSIIEGLDTFKTDYEEFTTALDREARVLNIPGVDNTNLDQWLGQIKDCQSVLDMSSRRSGKDHELVQAIAHVMKELSSVVKEEIDELKQCAALAAKLREAEQLAPEGSVPAVAQGIMIPVQQLMSPNEGVMDVLSGLSVEQLSIMEETLRRAKMSRLHPPGSAASLLPAPAHPSTRPSLVYTTARNAASNMKQFMSVMNIVPKNSLPPTKPSIKSVDGVPWLIFTYSTRSAVSTSYTVRADIDQVNLDDIPPEFQRTNCLYPSANGPEEEYKGARRDYERECNEQGWKLAHLNPTILGERKGVLQRAVIGLRNASAEQKSRRVKRQEKRTQSKVVQKEVRGPVLPIPRLIEPNLGRVPIGGLPPQPSSVVHLSWQPTLVSSLHEGVQRPVPSDLTPYQMLPPRAQTTLAALPPIADPTLQATHRVPSLGSFGAPTGDISFLEFDGYIRGQFKRLRLQVNISGISLDDIPFDFKKNNCVYSRSFLTGDDQSEHWNTIGIRQSEESFLNEIGWKLCLINSGLLSGKRLLLQQALDAYRRRFLPSTGQPRARVGPSLLTRRNSSSNPIYALFNGPDPARSRHRSQQARVRFDTRDPVTRRAHVGEGEEERTDKDRGRYGGIEGEAGDENEDEDEEEYGEAEDDEDDEGEDFDDDEDEGEEASEGDSFEDESGDGSSSEEVFHSQMSLLSFTGSIRTYSLGTGSGSARSRPRIHPAAAKLRKTSPPLARSGTLPSSTRKRSWTEFTSQTHLNRAPRFDKRIRTEGSGSQGGLEVVSIGDRNDDSGHERHGHEHGSEPDTEEEDKEGEGKGEGEGVGEGEGEAVGDGGGDASEQGSYNETDEDDEDEVDWWKSRLNNSDDVEDYYDEDED
ncbi:hypothetical protein BGX29_002141 [Mortierella sp. GBA35]|nr:hypothetical protein BGX29_002141 [Mortierella sp. GBA35]